MIDGKVMFGFGSKKTNQASEEEGLEALSDQELLASFEEGLHKYQKDVNLCSLKDLKGSNFDEVTFLSTERDYIHDLVVILDDRQLKTNLSMLKQVDSQWQEWIIERLRADFAKGAKRPVQNHLEPSDQWWWRLDELDKLTKSELNTL